MSKTRSAVKNDKVTTFEKNGSYAVKNSSGPAHVGLQFAQSLQDQSEKNLKFITKRLEANFESAADIATLTNPLELIEISSSWWHKMNQDYFAHYANLLEFNNEVRNELEDLVEKELSTAEVKTSELFDNSPV